MNILKVKYQRNGVSGIGFHSVLFEAPEYANEMKNCGSTFLATFESTGDNAGDRINIGSCRIENLSRFDLSWRGDTIGLALQAAIDSYCDSLGVERRLCNASFPKYATKSKK